MPAPDSEQCDLCEEPMVQMVADATKERVEYRKRCRLHMEAHGPFPAPEQETD